MGIEARESARQGGGDTSPEEEQGFVLFSATSNEPNAFQCLTSFLSDNLRTNVMLAGAKVDKKPGGLMNLVNHNCLGMVHG